MFTAALFVQLFFATSVVQVTAEPPPGQNAATTEPRIESPSVPTSAPTPRPKRRKPELKLQCAPAISNAVYFEGRVRSRVFCTVRVLYPDERFWCPAVAWSIGPYETPSAHESDCDPYEQVVAEEGEPAFWSEDRPKEFGLPPGLYEIKVSLMKSGRVIARDYFIVRVN